MDSVVRVGRATANAEWEICLPDRAVSRPHACFERQPDSEAWQIKDLGSANAHSAHNLISFTSFDEISKIHPGSLCHILI